jgi:uncharacterized membrane protein
MCKEEFLKTLRKALKRNKIEDIGERVRFYSEMLDDLMEEGMSESEAVAKISASLNPGESIGESDESSNATKEKDGGTALRVILIASSPIWGSLLIAALAVLFSLYAALWALVASAWAVFSAFAISGPAAVLFGVFTLFINSISGVGMIAAGFVLSGLAVFTFVGCIEATKGCVWLTKKCTVLLRACFTKKGVI